MKQQATWMMKTAEHICENSVDNTHDMLKQKCQFISTYAATLLGCGATCIRIRKNVGRIAQSFETDVEMTILPAHIILTLWDLNHTHSYNCTVKPIGGSINFSRNIKLSKLSWDIVEKHIPCEKAMQLYDQIMLDKPLNKWVVLLLASAANASFCRLFGGDFHAVGIVFFATLIGFLLKQILIEDKIDLRITTIASAFVASVIGAAGYVFNLTGTPDLALGTSVLYLVPGIPYINSVSDLIDHHYLCAFSRFMQAVILTVCLSLGLCGGMYLMQTQWF